MIWNTACERELVRLMLVDSVVRRLLPVYNKFMICSPLSTRVSVTLAMTMPFTGSSRRSRYTLFWFCTSRSLRVKKGERAYRMFSL